jgi:hypothetical protein
MIKVKRLGRKPNSVNVPRSAYPEIYRLHEQGQMCAHDIGEPYGITACGIRTLVDRCRANPALLVGKE